MPDVPLASGPGPGAPPASGDDAAALLGGDLLALSRGAGGALVEAVPLTTLPSTRSRRGSFRLRFSDGRTLKGYRFDSAGAADTFAALLPPLDRRYFPALVAVGGAAALVEWVEGTPLTPEGCSLTLMDEMGSVHAALHAVARPRGALGARPPGWPGRLASYLDELVSLGAIDPATRSRAEALVRTATPGSFPVGVVHKDFCRENMVVSTAGAVRVVDNETLAVDCQDYDLARTWCRWPMDPRQAETYLEAYRRHRATDTLDRHFPFWVVAALAESALFRLRRGLGAAALPLSRLGDVLAGYEASGRRPAFVERPDTGAGAGTPR